MRLIALTVLSSTVLVAAGTAWAANPALTPKPAISGPLTQKKPDAIPLALSITNAKKVGAAAYADAAPLSFEVEVSNSGTIPLDAMLVVTELYPTEGAPAEGSKIAEVPLKVSASGKATVTYQLPQLDKACEASYHRLSIARGNSTKVLKIAPSCTFGTTTPNPYAGQMPDRIHEARQNRVTYSSSGLNPAQARCYSPFFMNVTLANNRQTDTATGVYMTFENPRGEPYPKLTKYTLKPKETKRASVESRPFLGQAGRWTLMIHADKPELLHQPYAAAVVTRNCTIRTELVDTVPSLPKAPK